MATSGVRALRRSGFCGMRTKVSTRAHPAGRVAHFADERVPAAQEDEDELDLEAFNTLEFRVRVRLSRVQAPCLRLACGELTRVPPGRRAQVHRHAAHR